MSSMLRPVIPSASVPPQGRGTGTSFPIQYLYPLGITKNVINSVYGLSGYDYDGDVINIIDTNNLKGNVIINTVYDYLNNMNMYNISISEFNPINIDNFKNYVITCQQSYHNVLAVRKNILCNMEDILETEYAFLKFNMFTDYDFFIALIQDKVDDDGFLTEDIFSYRYNPFRSPNTNFNDLTNSAANRIFNKLNKKYYNMVKYHILIPLYPDNSIVGCALNDAKTFRFRPINTRVDKIFLGFINENNAQECRDYINNHFINKPVEELLDFIKIMPWREDDYNSSDTLGDIKLD